MKEYALFESKRYALLATNKDKTYGLYRHVDSYLVVTKENKAILRFESNNEMKVKELARKVGMMGY